MKQIIIGVALMLMSYGCTQNEQEMKQASCMEVVTFKVNPNNTNEQLKQAMEATNQFIKEFDGFVSRNTSMNEEGEFVDVVLWESKAKALKAAEQLMQNPELAKNFALIDPKSIVMNHYTIFSAQ
ncbi:hypothetical protein [Flagellimonas allohymeniacidonis]|uniref:ABM domain-containing protein n=1 Tax=Flagellimonas allohymeniacidonis TaxID=2517819 RepID=A0A4Q8QHG0_9FLAO|nr:hypothetical protein [Allomuricauda hymeniacidonis]TAI49207.1 hypothetical protein EW142_05260 [Allomuricauda hymeniacidonis]